jgi:hypothetical protein
VVYLFACVIEILGRPSEAAALTAMVQSAAPSKFNYLMGDVRYENFAEAILSSPSPTSHMANPIIFLD